MLLLHEDFALTTAFSPVMLFSCTCTIVLPNGDIEVGVHIADVTFFVSHGSPLDIEAQKRGTTFYLVDRRFDMLPSLLSSGISLLCFAMKSVCWKSDTDLCFVNDNFLQICVHCTAMLID